MNLKPHTLLIESQYLPCIQYMVYLCSFKKVVIPKDDFYIKQTYRNRCRINGANNIENLIIPIKKTSGTKPLTCQVEIDYEQKWLKNHARAIQSAYGKAPFFEYYGDEILDIFYKKPSNLHDLNRKLLTKCLEILEIDLKIEYSGTIDEMQKKEVYNAINHINPKTVIQQDSLFRSANYFQVFGSNFADNLSIIDLIFCEGPQARQLIGKSCVMD